VWAVEPGIDSFVLFNLSHEGFVKQTSSDDFDPATPGVELIVGNVGHFTKASGSSPGQVRGEVRIKWDVYSPDGTTLIVSSPVVRALSGYYPDPGDPANQGGGATETFYILGGGDDHSSPSFIWIAPGTPAEEARRQVVGNANFIFGSGVATTDAGTTRTLVIGLGIDIVTFPVLFFDPAGEEEGPEENDAAKFRITSLDATTLVQQCVIKILRIDKNGWYFDLEASVGNYLADSRAFDDEIRVKKYRDDDMGGQEQKTQYYDPRTCVRLHHINHTSPGL
jgi:hypothetical protein